MKCRLACACCLIWMASTSHGQQFVKCWSDSLSVPLTYVQLEWVSLDADTLLDVVLIGQSAAGELKLFTFQNTRTGLKEKNSLPAGFRSGSFQLADWNRDNRVDILVSGKTLLNGDAIYVFINNGDFTFTKAAAPLLQHAGLFRLADFNSDGRTDILTAGKQGPDGFIRVYENVMDALHLVYDSVKVDPTDVVTADFNMDGFPDFVLSGRIAANSVTLLFSNNSSFHFSAKALQNPLAGVLAAIDQNEDGKVDLFASGFSGGNGLLSEWRNDGVSLAFHQTYPAPLGASLFTADMNSDGLADKLLSGKDSLGHKINYVQDSSLVNLFLDTAGLVTQRAGDFDRDGDLDLLQVLDSARKGWIKILRNKIARTNRRPSNAGFSFAISTYDRTFLYWDSAVDDHDSSSLTYDVWLGEQQVTIQAADFDLVSGRRMTATPGNAGTMNSKIIRGLTDNRYSYKIQTVDNAYNGSYSSGIPGDGGVCTGGVITCFDLAHESMQACSGELVRLRAAAKVYWYSAARGLLATDTVYQFTAAETDTIYSFVPQGNDCSKNRIWTIRVHDEKTVSERLTVFTCQDQPMKFGIAPGWKNVEWNTSPVRRGVDTVSLVIRKDSVLVVKAIGTGGCPYRKEFDIRVSKPILELNGDVFRVLKGNAVQLDAISSATQFFWAPFDGLSSTVIRDPLAQPLQTTSYTVTVTDSIGCVASAKALVQVEEAAFIPNLFTPNGDGKNDRLLIFGLTQADGFLFRIFNREGILMYETNDPAHAANTGWNGLVGGTLQPSGVYYWKVEGTDNVGESLRLNGKKMGSILLVH